jgi:hypothetical protein
MPNEYQTTELPILSPAIATPTVGAVVNQSRSLAVAPCPSGKLHLKLRMACVVQVIVDGINLGQPVVNALELYDVTDSSYPTPDASGLFPTTPGHEYAVYAQWLNMLMENVPSGTIIDGQFACLVEVLFVQ